jgi:hypothetical protein
MDLAEGEGTPDRGPYETWRSLDPWHVAFMRILAPHIHDQPEARLWFAVLEQALVDQYVLRGRDMDPEDQRWYSGGWCRKFLRSQRCGEICDAMGLDRIWFRRVLDQYEQARR